MRAEQVQACAPQSPRQTRSRYSVCSTPGPIREATQTVCQKTEVSVEWAPPESDHGAPVVGYKVAIELEPEPEPKWHTLVECTKSAKPVYAVPLALGWRRRVAVEMWTTSHTRARPQPSPCLQLATRPPPLAVSLRCVVSRSARSWLAAPLAATELGAPAGEWLALRRIDKVPDGALDDGFG